MTTSYETLLVSQPEKFITLVTLNRPDAANALNKRMGMDLMACFSSLPVDCRAVIITGQGKHFCAGADLKERKGMTEAQWHEQHHAFEAALYAILGCSVPVIAAVNGAAFGGGLELALACDFIYASDTARFALTETTLGIIPGMGGTQNLPRAIGIRRAKELLFTGKALSAAEAHGWGMVNKLCSAESLMTDATACARTISTNAPLAVRATKQAAQQGLNLPLPEAIKCELTYYNKLLTTNDRYEGINAFNEKRKPTFTGE
jgi:enoyl-CoA hydratase/carnithine racemase